MEWFGWLSLGFSAAVTVYMVIRFTLLQRELKDLRKERHVQVTYPDSAEGRRWASREVEVIEVEKGLFAEVSFDAPMDSDFAQGVPVIQRYTTVAPSHRLPIAAPRTYSDVMQKFMLGISYMYGNLGFDKQQRPTFTVELAAVYREIGIASREVRVAPARRVERRRTPGSSAAEITDRRSEN